MLGCSSSEVAAVAGERFSPCESVGGSRRCNQTAVSPAFSLFFVAVPELVFAGGLCHRPKSSSLPALRTHTTSTPPPPLCYSQF